MQAILSRGGWLYHPIETAVQLTHQENSMYLKLFRAAVLSIGAVACQPESRVADGAADDSAASVIAGDSTTPPTITAAPASSGATAGTWVDPNTATTAELMGIPGMTQPLSDAIVSGRPHASMVSVNAVLAKTLGEKERDTVYTRLWMPLDLNKATGAEIMLIPGVGKKMEHEFMEYRPYTSIEQFRREIGKYVDKEEVARLEKYVAVR